MSLLFLKTFARDLDVGALWPTARGCVRRVLRNIDFSKRLVIVEYGPGTGAFTKELLANLSPDSKLLLIEKNEDFVRALREKFAHDARVHLFHDSAEHVEELLKKAGEPHADYILSGIPFSRIPEPQAEGILRATKRSLGNGVFLVYQYLPSVRRLISPFFACITMKCLLWNVPPLFLVIAQR